MDVEDPDWGCISPEQLKISETRWASLMRAIVEAGYIAGVKVVSSKTGTPQVYLIEPRITLEGLEYLENNSTMQKIYRAAKGIKDVIPGA